MKRRLYISALLVGTCVAVASPAVLAQDATAGEAKPEGDKPAEGEAAPAEAPAAAAEEKPAEAPAPAAEQPAEPAAAEPAPATAEVAVDANAVAAEPAGDELPEAGYIPGYRRHPHLGDSVWHPRSPALPGGLTVPYGAPSAPDTWTFTYSGYFSASVKAALREREQVGNGQSKTVLKAPPETPDVYGGFTGTGSLLGNWVSMAFEYGNRTVSARTSISTYNPSRPTSYVNIGSQYFIDNAYLSFRLPQIDKLRMAWAVGAFQIEYGQLGQYGHMYGSPFVGRVGGTGELLTAEYDLTDTLVLQAEHGFWGSYGKAPTGINPTQGNGWPDESDPAAWMQAARIGLVRNGDTVIQGGLLFMSNWAQDDTAHDQFDDADGIEPPQPLTPYDESNPKDPSMRAFGFESRMRGRWFHVGLAGVYGTANDAWNLTGMRVWTARSGDNFTADYLGQESGGTGSIWGVGSEVKIGWGALVRSPEPFWGEGWDVVTTLAGQVGAVDSDSPLEERDFTMYKFGLDNRVKFIKWIAAGLRFDRVVPRTDDGAQTFHVIAPRLEFQSNWTSHETITLQWAHWFYGDKQPFINDDTPNTSLDKDVVSFGFGMWW
jgi:hypothetical protein